MWTLELDLVQMVGENNESQNHLTVTYGPTNIEWLLQLAKDELKNLLPSNTYIGRMEFNFQPPEAKE